MSEIPQDLKYLSSHEWVLVEGDVATVGITDHAQESLGDLVYVELPEEGSEVAAGDSIVVVESVKAASDSYAPLSGAIIEVNAELEDAPERINQDPYGDGWMYKIGIEDSEEIADLLNAEAYQDVVADEE